MLLALAALLTHLATNRLRYAGLMGLALGCAYLTKSFAFLFALLCVAVLAAFRWLWLKQSLIRVLPAALLGLTSFAIIAGPYAAALSHQKGRLDFGDSGSLNYAWYVGGTEKMHLQPYEADKFGSAEVHLKHPERELTRSPLILSYAEMTHGTYPDWFDTTYWNEQIKPHFRLRDELPRAGRNAILVVRYLLNHPEALILFALLLVLGARLTLQAGPGRDAFWLPPLALGAAAWSIYGLVNTEERYVTFAYLCIILPLFATLRIPGSGKTTEAAPSSEAPASSSTWLPRTASLLVFLLALLATAESLRVVLEDRRQISLRHYPGGWYSPTAYPAAEALAALGIRPGDTVACVGFQACLGDFYWARLAGVRTLTEIYDPETPVYSFLHDLPNREQAIAIVRATGAKALVGDFANARVSDTDPAFRDWHQLADTSYYALTLK